MPVAECGKIQPPEVAKVRSNGLCVARNKNAGDHQPRQRRYLGNGKQVLHGRAQLESKDIQHRKKNHNHNAAKVLRVQANIHVAQHHGANGNRRNVSNVKDPIIGGNRREKISQKLAKRHAHGGHGSSLDDQKQSPSIQEAPERAQRFTQINILSAGFGHHGGKFAI